MGILDEIKNDITKTTPASFEPTLDYIVTKIPRFAFEKFKGADNTLTSAMKSVGETMAIGRSFQESIQKALRSIETELDGFNELDIPGYDKNKEKETIYAALTKPTPERILYIAQAYREGLKTEEIHSLSKIDPWFLDQIEEIIEIEKSLLKYGKPKNHDELILLKSKGFSDSRIASLLNMKPKDIKNLRDKYGIKPVYKKIDSCAGEFESKTPYLYSTYEKNEDNYSNETNISNRKKIIILGGGPNRIGQGIEFDYCCVHAAFALSSQNYETIMINCNPETVSTDYDTSDRLYFEPLTEEDVIEIVSAEKEGKLLGCIVQFGGQTPLKLCKSLEEANIPVIGTSPDMIDLAEDRDRFQKLLKKLKLKQPANGICNNSNDAKIIANKIGYPVLVRPSYVLGGRAMEIIYDSNNLESYIDQIISSFGQKPILIDRFLSDAVEVDVDVIADGKISCLAGVMEHIEEAGVHSGDSACALPPHSLSKIIINEIERQSKILAKALKVIGLMNIQFAVKGLDTKNPDIYILEVNPRASRTIPFVAKATGNQFAGIASKIMAGDSLKNYKIKSWNDKNKISVKEAVFPFGRFTGVDTILGPEMKSTGEAMGLAKDFGEAYAKSQIAVGSNLPISGTLFVSVKDKDKDKIIPLCKNMLSLGFKIIATKGTANHLSKNNIEVKKINKVSEGRPHLVDSIKNGLVQIIFNTTEGKQSIEESFSLRRAAITAGVPYYTTFAGSNAATKAIIALNKNELNVKPIQSY